jgi:Tfp pilus assembly protein PilF
VSDENELIDLVLGLYEGEINLEDLTDEEQEMAITGYRLLIEKLKDDPDYAEMTAGLQMVLDVLDASEEADEAFDKAIEEAESRGSIYVDFGDEIH